MENDNQGDSSASTEVENTQPSVLDQNSLAQMISASKVPTSQETEETEQQEESTEVSEQTEVNEQAEGLIETETQNQESEAEAETEDLEEAEEEDSKQDVLSKRDKALNKLRNRNKKLTKNWRTAEEKIEALENEVNELKASRSEPATAKKPEGLVHKVQNAESVEDLVELQETAKAISANTEELLDEMIDNGDSEIEHNGTVFTRAELRNAKKEADEVLNKHIGNKADLFQQRAQYDEVAKTQFEFFENPDSEEFKFVENIMADKGFSEFLNGRPEQFYILGLLAEGQRSLNARRSEQQSSEEKGKTEEPQKKVASTPKIAPSVPGVTGIKSGVAPARASGEQIAQNKRKEILSRDRLDTTGLAQLISASKQKT